MKHTLLLVSGLLGTLSAQAQTYLAPVPAADPTLQYSRASAGQPAQHPAWLSQRLSNAGSAGISLSRFTYDAAGRVATQVVTDSLTGQLQSRQTNTYNPGGQLVSRQLEQWTNGQPGATTVFDYTYDAWGHLTRAASSAGEETEHRYTYDAAGTITAYTQSGRRQAGQALQPAVRIQFALRNGQWQSSTEELYRNGAWQLVATVHRFGWHHWGRRQLSGRRVTNLGELPSLAEQRDTLLYARSGPDSLSTALTETPDGTGAWAFARQVRTRFDARRYQVSTHNRSRLPDGSFFTLRDSTALGYDAQGRLLRLRYYTNTGINGIPSAGMFNIITQYYGPEVVTGTARPAAALPLTLSPNPATHQLTLTVPALPADAAPVEATIVNALGQVVAQRRLRSLGGNLTETWNVQNWPAGLYVVRLRSAAGTHTQRFLKQ